MKNRFVPDQVGKRPKGMMALRSMGVLRNKTRKEKGGEKSAKWKGETTGQMGSM